MNLKKAERQVSIGGLDVDVARKMVAGLDGESNISEVAKAVPNFTEVKKKGFTAKFAVIDRDLVIQFFLPAQAEQHLTRPEGRKAWMDYWLQKFPPKLDVVARQHFEAEYPRLMVKWTEEVASWWFKAQGFGTALDPAGLTQRFLSLLEDALQARSETPRES